MSYPIAIWMRLSQHLLLPLNIMQFITLSMHYKLDRFYRIILTENKTEDFFNHLISGIFFLVSQINERKKNVLRKM